jgi:predicted nucleic acid-binding protein
MLSAGRRDVSLVDYTSFHVMRVGSIRKAFTFDPHFSEQGFTPVPSP